MAKAALGQDSLLGRTLGHYRIIEQIGAGGMGVVYRAHDEHLDRDVAVKVLPRGSLADDKARQQFHKEAHALSRLNHPNIAIVHDFDSFDGIDFLAEELVPGLSLDEMLAPGPLSEKEIITLGTQLCEGLAAAHGRGILHRDIKPSNIRVAPDGRLKILDFGLADTVALGGVAGGEQATATETQTTAGTLPYMSPEQLRNEKLDARTDIWSVGCVLYEMATGRRPFLGQGTVLVNEILTQEPTPPSEANHKVSAGLEAITRKCLEKDATLRYASASDVAVDLRRLAASASFVPVTRKRHAGFYLSLSLAGLALFGLIGGGVWRLLPHASAMQHKSIAVLSFRNMSGDPSLNWLDNGLPELLTTNLSQVKGMDVLSREQVFRAIKRKGQQDAPELSPDVALDVARDAGADTCVTGSLMKLGTSKLRVDLHVQDTRTGKILFSDKVESEDINGIFTMVDAMTARLAERALPATQLPASTPQVAGAMTSNVEAMRHYQAGADYSGKMQFAKAVREFEEAARLDPQFAMAYSNMSVCYGMLGNMTKAIDTIRIAERLASRLPRVQQLILQWWKAGLLGDADGQIQAAEELTRETPRGGLHHLAMALYMAGDPERAAAVLREAIALDPNDPGLYDDLAYLESVAGHEAAALAACDQYQAHAGASEPNVWDTRGDVLFAFGRDEEAAAVYRHVLELDPDLNGGAPWVKLVAVYADQGNYDLATEELNRYKKQATSISLLQVPAFQAQLLQAKGMPEQALPLIANLVPALLKAGQASDAFGALGGYATLAFLLGQEQAALAFIRQQKLPNKQEQLWVSSLEAIAGNEAGAEAALQEYAQANPEVPARVIEGNRDWNTAQLLLRRADREAAGRLLPKLKVNSDPLATLTRGRIRLLVNDHAGAERDFKTAIAWLRLYTMYPQMPLIEQLSHFYLGQLYEQTGKREDAIREYQKFLTPFAKSTSRLPQIAEARAALKRLQ